MKVIEGLESKGHHIYMDKYYLSPTLFLDIHEKGFGACGIVSIHRTRMPNAWMAETKDKQARVQKWSIQ